ncbi:hypothetical protein Tco_0840028 [Tanacetum coccineum]|uniref:Uncharacterized protein n=1 Tax=Tanacetum coccineum TaxID=301880 RepID=A0ABQ5AWU9_9ASTR
MEEINNFQQELDENFYQAWERFKELLMKYPQHYLTEMQEKIEYISSNSVFSDNEKQETDNSGMAEALAALEATLKIKKEKPKEEKQSVNYYVDPYEPPIPFPRRLEQHTEEALDLVENKPRTEEDEEIRMNPSKREELEWENLSLNDWMKIRYEKVCKMTRERILKDQWRDRFGDEEDDLEENLEDPEECEEDKANAIMGDIHDKLNDDWLNNTSEDEDDLERDTRYLEPRNHYDRIIDVDDEQAL